MSSSKKKPNSAKASQGKQKKKNASKKDTAKRITDSTDADKRPSWQKWLLGVVAAVVVVALVGVIAALGYEWKYQDTVYPGVTFNGEDMAGQSFDEVLATISAYEEAIETNGLTFSYSDTSIQLDVTAKPTLAEEVAAAEADAGTELDEQLEIQLVDIDAETTAQAIYQHGRTGSSAWENMNTKLNGLMDTTSVPLVYTVDTENLANLLEIEFGVYEEPFSNAYVNFTEDGSLEVVEHVDGTGFDWEDPITDVEQQLSLLQPVTVELARVTLPAEVTTADIEAETEAIETVLNQAPVSLTFEDQTFEVSREELQTWLAVTAEDGLTFNTDLVDTFLDDIAAEIDSPVQEGRFSLDITGEGEEQEVTLQQFAEGVPGLEMNVPETVTALQTALLDEGATTFELTVETVEPRANPDNLDELGIKELLGSGDTNYAGSPPNRIVNIEKGMDKLNGLLFAPGEEFSLLEALGPIDLAHGWLSELVIKGDKLEKEAGGGLCQVGSTVFRSTMNSALEVTERRNHSWAISYYDYEGQAGVDATIYEPAPDYKFRNDTDNWILLRSRVEYPLVILEIWGTDDGREGSFTVPTNYNYVYPGAAEEVVDESLAPGERRCVQNAYTGLSASFDYNRTLADGTEETITYTSTYRARPQRCLVGPAESEAAPDAPEESNEGTEESGSTETPDENPAETPEEPTETPADDAGSDDSEN